MYANFALLRPASLRAALGFRYRVAIVAFFAQFPYVEPIDKTTYLDHDYWGSLASLLLAFPPPQR